MYDPLISNRAIDPSNPINWSHPLNQGRISWWKVMSNSGWRGGATLRDLVRGSGHRPNDGTLVQGVTWRGAAGLPGAQGCLSYDGSTGYVDVLPVSAMAPAKFTVAVWALTLTFPAAASISAFVSKFDTGASADSLVFYIDPTPQWVFFAGNAGAASTTISANVWTHIVGTWDGANAIIYNNGQAAQSTAGTLSYTTPSDFLIGADSGPSSFWNGLIDDVAFWQRTLTAGEVAALYLLSKQGYPGLLNRLPLHYQPLPIGDGDSEVLTNTTRVEW